MIVTSRFDDQGGLAFAYADGATVRRERRHHARS
jgi:hypothetical protein